MTRRKRNRIPYDFIDVQIRKIVKLLNSFPFCATTLSCAGHPHNFGDGIFTGDCYVHLKALDEVEFIKFMAYVASGFKDEAGLWFHTSKQYHFSRKAKISKHSFYWRIGFFVNAETEEETKQKLGRGRKMLKQLIQKYKDMY